MTDTGGRAPAVVGMFMRTTETPREPFYLLFASAVQGLRRQRLALRVGAVAAGAGQAVHARAMQQCRLSGGDVALRAFPRLERRRLQGAAVGERQRPGQSLAVVLVHRCQVCGGELVALPARQEYDAG